MTKYKDLVPELPAEGILKQKSWPDAKFYKVPCECGCNNSIDFSLRLMNAVLILSSAQRQKQNTGIKHLILITTNPGCGSIPSS